MPRPYASHRTRATWLAVACFAAALACPRPACADSAAELRASAQDIAGQLNAQKSAGQLDAAAQQHAIERLGKLALAFIDLNDRVANTGGERAERAALLNAYEAVSAPLDDIYDRNSGAIDRMA